MDRFIAATMSLSIHFLHWSHQSCLTFLSTWLILFLLRFPYFEYSFLLILASLLLNDLIIDLVFSTIATAFEKSYCITLSVLPIVTLLRFLSIPSILAHSICATSFM